MVFSYMYFVHGIPFIGDLIFTSSIHNAMKWGGDRHLIAMLTASFAKCDVWMSV